MLILHRPEVGDRVSVGIDGETFYQVKVEEITNDGRFVFLDSKDEPHCARFAQIVAWRRS